MAALYALALYIFCVWAPWIDPVERHGIGRRGPELCAGIAAPFWWMTEKVYGVAE